MSANLAVVSRESTTKRATRAPTLHVVHDPMGVWVDARLAAWGREFRVWTRGPAGETCAGAVWPPVSPLWVLLKFGGVSPRGTGGRPPVHVDEEAWVIERIVADMFRVRPVEACVLRAYYGGDGRQKVERRQLAERLSGVRLSAQAYFAARDRGVAWVMGALA